MVEDTNIHNKNNTNLYKKILIGVLFLFGYFLGGLTYHKQLFPLEQIRAAKKVLLGGTSEQAKSQPSGPKPRNTIFQTFSPIANVVMIGDSITEGGEWGEIFSKTKVANRGIGGDRADDILGRMEQIFSVHAKKAFIMVGINDIYGGQSIDTILNNYANIVQQLKRNEMTVYIQSTLECSKSKCGNTLEKIRALNEKLKIYAAQNDVTYININEWLSTEMEGLSNENTYDGIHLIGNGYLKWSKILTPYVYSN